MIKAAIVGYGNVGRYVHDALRSAPDMELQCVVGSPGSKPKEPVANIWAQNLGEIEKHGKVDVALLCLPSRKCPDTAEALLKAGINTVDAFDIHGEIWDVKCRLEAACAQGKAAAILASGWDPGSDSVVRALMEAMAPRGISYTDFGPGMSMGHTVGAKAIEGVANALSMTMPVGAGVHRRMVYVELEPGATLQAVTERIKADAYFSHDETHVMAVESVRELMDMGHGVHILRKGVAGETHNQLLEFQMKINNPAVTAQVMVSMARAVVKQTPGCYTMIEVPPIDMLPGEKKDLIARLV